MTSLIDTITDCPACKPLCPRCLEPRKITHRVVSDDYVPHIMDIKVCDGCAEEGLECRYIGPRGQFRVMRLERDNEAHS